MGGASAGPGAGYGCGHGDGGSQPGEDRPQRPTRATGPVSAGGVAGGSDSPRGWAALSVLGGLAASYVIIRVLWKAGVVELIIVAALALLLAQADRAGSVLRGVRVCLL
jgi:hypothetical protein